MRRRLGARVIQLPFGQHADDLGMRVLRHHPHELLAVALGHPVLGLDRFARGDSSLECRESSGIFWSVGWAAGLRRHAVSFLGSTDARVRKLSH